MMQEANEISRKKADIMITPKLGDHLSTDSHSSILSLTAVQKLRSRFFRLSGSL